MLNRYCRGDIIKCNSKTPVSPNRKVPGGNYLVVFSPDSPAWEKDCYYLLFLSRRFWQSRCNYADEKCIENENWQYLGRVEIDGKTPIKNLNDLIKNFPELKKYMRKIKK